MSDSFCSCKKDHQQNADGPYCGDPVGIRTLDLLIRSQSLYPAELPSHMRGYGLCRFPIPLFWQGQKESNPQPMVLETTTLPVELYPYKNQRLPILPGRFQPSTFGVYGLNCCVRHGNRWIPVAIVTELCCRARALTTTWKSIYSVLTFLTRTS
jgi:hypothetical protein